MAIVNRDKDPSEQKDVINWVSQAQVNTGATLNFALIPYPCALQSVKSAAYGLSGAMQLAFKVLRFTSGGQTAIGLGISNMILNAFGTSGSLGYSGLVAQGSTLLNLLAGDLIHAESSVANTAALSVNLEFVVKKLQDVVSHNGVST